MEASGTHTEGVVVVVVVVVVEEVVDTPMVVDVEDVAGAVPLGGSIESPREPHAATNKATTAAMRTVADRRLAAKLKTPQAMTACVRGG